MQLYNLQSRNRLLEADKLSPNFQSFIAYFLNVFEEKPESLRSQGSAIDHSWRN